MTGIVKPDGSEQYEKAVMAFAGSPADSQTLMGCQFFKIFDENQLEYILIANGSSGASLAKATEFLDGTIVEGTGLLDMTWKERESVWGDDIWVRTEDGLDVIGNQIQVADVTLGKNQSPFGLVVYGRGNNDTGEEGAVSGSVIYTGVLGPLITKNPRLAAGIIEGAATLADVKIGHSLDPSDIEMEDKSAEYIKDFMKAKMKPQEGSSEA